MIGITIAYDQGQFAHLSGRLSAANRALLRGQTTHAVADWLLERVKQYPRYRYVSRVEAYGVPFFTDKQRRYFFAALRDGRIRVPYPRSNALRDAWQLHQNGSEFRLDNGMPYAHYVMGERYQSRMQDKIGWRTTEDITRYYGSHIGRVAIDAVDDVLHEAGLT